MRLVLFGPGYPFRGGIASTTTALVGALEERGNRVLFLSPFRQYPRFLYPGKEDRDPDACPEIEGSLRLYAPMEAWTWRRAFARAREFRADAWVFPYWTWAWAPFFLALLRAAGKIPCLAIVHNPADHQADVLKKMAARQVLGRCGGLMTHAEKLAAQLREEYPDPLITEHLLPPPSLPDSLPTREDSRRDLGIGSGEKLAVFSGLIRPYKGVDLLLDAVALLDQRSTWRFIVAGEAWQGLEKELSDQVSRLNIEESVQFFFGWQEDSVLEKLLAAADLVVLPYRSGTQSAVAPLALSRGVPVLATDVGGLGEIIRHGVNGILLFHATAETLAGALTKLDSELLQALRRGACTSVENLSWTAYAERLEDILNRLKENGAL